MRYLKEITKPVITGKKQYAILIDPDKVDKPNMLKIIKEAESHSVDFFFVGGSLITKDTFQETISFLKHNSTIPVLIFPGDNIQLSAEADALLLLSLISGRNPEMLIGKHVAVAPLIKQSKIEVIPVGYMLVDTGRTTSAIYMSQTTPIPYEKSEIAACTAMAGEMLGLRALYMDAGSGADKPISPSMIKSVKKSVAIPLIVGGGIRTVEEAKSACEAGADIIVTGNIIEKNREIIADIAKAIHQF